MAKMEVVVSHSLTPEEALRRVQGLLGETKDQFGDRVSNLRETWKGNTCSFSFTAMRFSVSGTLNVDSSQVKVSGTLPWAASFFKGKIESTIRDRATSLLA